MRMGLNLAKVIELTTKDDEWEVPGSVAIVLQVYALFSRHCLWLQRARACASG